MAAEVAPGASAREMGGTANISGGYAVVELATAVSHQCRNRGHVASLLPATVGLATALVFLTPDVYWC